LNQFRDYISPFPGNVIVPVAPAPFFYGVDFRGGRMQK
jgi:hypothetical protein